MAEQKTGVDLFKTFAFDKSAKGQARLIDPVSKLVKAIDEQIAIVNIQKTKANPQFAKFDWVSSIVMNAKPYWQVKIGHFPLQIADETHFAVETLDQALTLMNEAKRMVLANEAGLADQVRKKAESRGKKISENKGKKA
ncbi:hypothetical protein AGRHK599_LOCUS1294 [Rhizobium rhizogenes]|uniref:Uncharacterized protein n=1 Tax=Rhizobium rhizogenes TaxID=359 RepID=A0AAN2DCJ3_RHIRH|nr:MULTISPECIES: hypothetical protein [Rhizobium/Agrobacterium group]AQS61709.1 hypothetical protein B0909_05190 [Rhizobium rhizogenes]MCZ7443069.1 hypothetical protein [Rhizobium rhizogenes]NSZ79055.1 hypothetical protein [Agrobacterium tumefaciens]OAM65845.1 hypothetical protein A8L48_22930 [Rhizobium rhizogenes]CAD0211269.1 hypothetical protein AGRHK599_LOCUS1294 [Rhizobium rhizogenes]